MAEAIIAAATEEKTSKTAIGSLPDQWQKRSRLRKDSAAARTLPILMKMPIVTARILAGVLGVSFQAASNALNSLQRDQIVCERTGQGRNRIFAAEEVIAILARPFGEDPEIALEGARRTLGQ